MLLGHKLFVLYVYSILELGEDENELEGEDDANWNKLSKQYNVEHTEVLGNETFSWVINAKMEAQSQIVRLEEVCQYLS